MSYFGTKGPRFVLRDEGRNIVYDYTLPAPHSISDNPYQIMQDQRRDINNIMRSDKLQFKYQNTLVWKPTEVSGSNTLEKLINIINWSINNYKSITFYPHSDTPLIKYDVIVTKGTPYYFTKMPYNAFTITVESVELFDKIPNPDALAAVDFSEQTIAVSTQTNDEDLTIVDNGE